MLSHLNNEQVEQYFLKFDSQIKRMPQQERAEMHLELRQHLESLIAAHEELGATREEALEASLRQFGDPEKIGRRLYFEWLRAQGPGPSEEMRAVLTMIALYPLSLVVATVPVLGALWLSYVLWHWMPDVGNALLGLLLVGAPLLAGWVLGRLFPNWAVSGAFYACCALIALPLSLGAVSVVWDAIWDVSALMSAVAWAVCLLSSACGAAYVSSARRRGQWYRVRLADLRLKLK